MIQAVSARAYANIALVKYWGKRDNELNAPATPSISLALEALRTDTTIERISAGPDRVQLDGKTADQKTTSRIQQYLQLWRDLDLLEGAFSISSTNTFPTAAGLASSASGFAALATGLAALAKRKVNRRELSRLARRGSGSAARSIPGGISALPAGPDPTARKIMSPDAIPWGMVVAVVHAPAKEIGSTEGMVRSRLSSPYFNAWVRTARHDYRRMRYAFQEMDLDQVGAITEGNALAMHACMIATRPSLVYWSEATVELLRQVRNWREEGLQAYATIDAGPHVVFLCPREQLEDVRQRAANVDGVDDCFASLPAPAARVMKWS
ncbi:diphosphomevalonate decarboxylase [bacterium]|nr:diphosphomevalonate decarboxylase [bacterium]